MIPKKKEEWYLYNQFCTTLVTTTFFLFLLDKNNRGRKKKRENKNICEHEMECCFKSYQKLDLQISFLKKKQNQLIVEFYQMSLYKFLGLKKQRWKICHRCSVFCLFWICGSEITLSWTIRQGKQGHCLTPQVI